MLIVTRLLGKSEKRLGRAKETWRMILGNDNADERSS